MSLHIWLTVTSSIQRRAVSHAPTGVAFTWPTDKQGWVSTLHVYVKAGGTLFSNPPLMMYVHWWYGYVLSLRLTPSSTVQFGSIAAVLKTVGSLAQGQFNYRATSLGVSNLHWIDQVRNPVIMTLMQKASALLTNNEPKDASISQSIPKMKRLFEQPR